MQYSALANDPRFATNQNRFDHWPELFACINAWTKQTRLDVLRRLLTDAQIPFSVINSIDQAIAEPQFLQQDMFATVKTTAGDTIRVPGTPLKLSETPSKVRTAAPLIGQHSVEILTNQLGLSAEKIEALIAAKIIGVAND